MLRHLWLSLSWEGLQGTSREGLDFTLISEIGAELQYQQDSLQQRQISNISLQRNENIIQNVSELAKQQLKQLML